MRDDRIVIRGARQHNLRNIDVTIPKGRLVVITGVSGSGKSSLAFDTLFAEGQRRYVESLSAYARQFLQRMDKPDVDSIEGLSPAIAIEHRGISRNPRSTVGTVTEIYDYLRLLFSRVGHAFCYGCGREISAQTPQQMVDQLLDLPADSRVMVMAPLVAGRKGEHRRLLDELRRDGFVRLRIDGTIQDLGDDIALDGNQQHDIDLVVDRLVVRPDVRNRITESLELALRYGEGTVRVLINGNDERTFSERFACMDCGISYPEISPRFFSFNSPYGACPVCGGLGVLGAAANESLDAGFVDGEDRATALMSPCPECGGARLKKEALHIRIRNTSIADICAFSIAQALDFFETTTFTPREEEIARLIVKEIRERLRFLLDVGLDYLSLDRVAHTLSGGEAERIRLATQIGSGLSGVLYILDEPSIGLHVRDHLRLLGTLERLRDLGNTVIVVEHDRETILAADQVIDMGPGSGVRGGNVVFSGTPQGLMTSDSLTGRYISETVNDAVPFRRRGEDRGRLVLKGARTNNLKDITLEIPLGLFTCVTGVSGSGKSSLIVDTLVPALVQCLYGTRPHRTDFDALLDWNLLDKVIEINQMPIGRTPRSNPMTYTGILAHVRALLAQVPEARMRGYTPSRFSFNVKGGRCEACRGEGIIRIEMHFLPDVYVTCEECSGNRFNRETLEIRYKGRNVAEILDMTAEEALVFFRNIPQVRRRLEILNDVGLGYLKLGQPGPTLSGGEAQRIKLARELGKRATGRTLYVLDEPTMGLHAAEIRRLLDVLDKLVVAGNTVVVIEHNLDVIKSADHIIDLGPEGGDDGGWIVATGAPEDVASMSTSHTGRFLRGVLPGIR
jgi:excinuclease ABC subunit A